MSSKRNIAVVTTTRADFGLLHWLLKEIDQDQDLNLQLVVTGTHLSQSFGMTVDEIEQAGFDIKARIPMLMQGDTPVELAKSSALLESSFADEVARLKPDIIVVLGDRYEILPIAHVATLFKIPLAHIHGGELTSGAIDDAIRHSVSKMASIHFPIAKAYANRLEQMGEQPNSIFCFGAPGLDHIKRTQIYSENEIKSLLGLPLDKKVILATYHPETLSDQSPEAAFSEFQNALSGHDDYSLVLTKSNADSGAKAINALVDQWANTAKQVYAFDSLGLQKYLSLAKCAECVIGNSSSGVIEVPLMNTPTINIGLRQEGRLRANSVLDCAADSDSIKSALEKVLSGRFMQSIGDVQSPFGVGDASSKIKEVLKTIPLEGVCKKQFKDVGYDIHNC